MGSVSQLVDGVLAGQTRQIARALRCVDDRESDRYIELLKALHPHRGRAYVVGITGTPGAGKSTLVDRVIEGYRAEGKTVGVVAVDPTSPYTGGAILGDRIRMQRHFLDKGVFIRSLATRGHLGGLSRSAADVIRVLDAAQFDVVIVETVGVGQDELEVARLADTTIVVVPPGMGDDIQAIKAGILEVADIFAVNKADRDGADMTVRDLEQMLALDQKLVDVAQSSPGHSAGMMRAMRAAGNSDSERWIAPVLKTVATRNSGVAELLEVCAKHRAFTSGTEAGRLAQRMRAMIEFEMIYRDRLVLRAEGLLGTKYGAAVEKVADGADPYTLADELVSETVREEQGP